MAVKDKNLNRVRNLRVPYDTPKKKRNRIFVVNALGIVFIIALFVANYMLSKDRPGREYPSEEYYAMENKKFAWNERSKEAVKTILKDADSARFRNVFYHKGQTGDQVTCGEVNAKNSFGAYAGYERFVSSGGVGPTVLESHVVDFDVLWRKFCVF